jgi:hypothetical protein
MILHKIYEQDEAGTLTRLPSVALERKYPHADKEWIWQYVFPAIGMTKDPRTNLVRRYHLHESGVQKALKQAVRCLRLSEASGWHYKTSRMSHLSALRCNPPTRSRI